MLEPWQENARTNIHDVQQPFLCWNHNFFVGTSRHFCWNQRFSEMRVRKHFLLMRPVSNFLCDRREFLLQPAIIFAGTSDFGAATTETFLLLCYNNDLFLPEPSSRRAAMATNKLLGFLGARAAIRRAAASSERITLYRCSNVTSVYYSALFGPSLLFGPNYSALPRQTVEEE